MASQTDKNQWRSVLNDKSLYDKLTEPNKYKFWKFGLENNMFPIDKIGPNSRAEMNKYVSADEQNKYGRAIMAQQTQSYKEFETSPVQVAKQKAEAEKQAQIKAKQEADRAKVLANVTGKVQQGRIQTDATTKPSASFPAPVVPTAQAPVAPKLPSPSRQVRGQERSQEVQLGAQQKRQDLVKRLADEKAFKATIQPQIDALDAEIDKLKKEQGLFGTKNLAKIAQLDKKKQELSLAKSPTTSQFYDAATLGLGKELAKGFNPEIAKAIESTEGRPGAGLGNVLGTGVTQLGLYGSLGKVVAGSKFLAPLVKGAGESLAKQFLGSQIANLAVDTIIQTPIEAIDAINNDKSLGQAAKEWATNRAIDVVFNGVIEGVVTLVKARQALSTPQAQTALRNANIEPEQAIRALESGDQQAIQEIRDVLSRTGLEGAPSLRQDLIGMRTPDIYVNPQGGASASLPRASMPLDVPTNQMALPAPKDIPKAGATTQIAQPKLDAIQPRPNSLPMSQRNFDDVGSKKIKAFQHENPEVKPFYKEQAQELLSDLKDTQKGERIYTEIDGDYKFTGQPRVTSSLIADIKDSTGKTYTEIRTAIEKIIKDNGLENNALSKRIEMIIDESLTNGYTDFNGMKIPPNRDYINIKNQLEGVQPKSFVNPEFDQWAKELTGMDDFTPEQIEGLKGVYKNMTGIDVDATPSAPNFDFSAKVTKEVPRTVTPGELTEQRLLDLQNRVRSGEVTQQEAEIVAKQLVEEMQAPRPQETIAEQGVIEPNQNVLPQGGTLPMVEAKTPETPIVGESESGLFRSTMAKNIDSPIRQKLEQAASDFVLPTTSNEARRDMARSIMADDFESALTHVKSGDKLTNSVEPFLADEVIGELNRLGRYDDIADVIASQAKKARASGQEVQAFSQWAKTSPEGIQRWAIRSLEEANIPKDEIKETATQLYKEVKEIREMTVEELAEQIRKQSKLYKNTSTEDLMGIVNLDNVKQLLTAKSMQKALAKIPTATASKLSTWQAMSHLLNFRTFSRNILGNMASMSGEKIAKIPAKAFDKLLALKTGQDSISLSYPKFMDEFKEGMGAAKQSALEISLGVNRVNKDKYDLFMGDVFKSKPLRAGEKLLRYSLDTPDAFFKGMARADAIHTAVKARLGKEADKMTLSQLIEKATLAEIEEAKKYSEFVTFQNESWLANFLGSTKKLLNKVGFGPEEARFGLGDLTLKYTRVPGNIITRGIEYSPVGYFKSLDKLLSAKNLSATDQRKLAMELGRATTGTSLMALGMALRNAGVITGEPISDDYDAQAFERAQGKGEYKVNLSAIKRAITGQDPTPQEGDRMESYNWIEPFSVPFAIGAKIADKYNRLSDEEKLDINLGAELQDLSKLVTQESFDLPSLYVVQQMAREYAYGSDMMEVASIPFKEAIPGIVTPSIVRQIAQTIDPTVRETRAEFAGGDDIANKVIANIPFLSRTLPPKLDSLGREQQRTGGILGTMVNPAASSTLKPSAYSDKLDAILKITGAESVYPERKPPTKITFKPVGSKISKTTQLTPEETQEYQRIVGKEYDERVAKLLRNTNADQLSDKRANLLVDQIKDIKSDAKQTAIKAILRLRKRNQ